MSQGTTMQILQGSPEPEWHSRGIEEYWVGADGKILGKVWRRLGSVGYAAERHGELIGTYWSEEQAKAAVDGGAKP